MRANSPSWDGTRHNIYWGFSNPYYLLVIPRVYYVVFPQLTYYCELVSLVAQSSWYLCVAVVRHVGQLCRRERAETNKTWGGLGEIYGHRKEDTMFLPGKSVFVIIISSQCCSNSCRGIPHSSLGERGPLRSLKT